MTTPRKHAALIKAWADGAEIERYSTEQKAWVSCDYPLFSDDLEYRVKMKTTVKRHIYMDSTGDIICYECSDETRANIEFTFSASGHITNVRLL